jgi:muramoyltetrapeptide carboxypeptidase LdcA involved in peptidoglycan recycling
LKGVKGLILGDFTDCRDTVPTVLKAPATNLKNPSPSNLMPLRVKIPDDQALQFVFQELARRTNLPILTGLPLGHGDRHASIQLGQRYQLTQSGHFYALHTKR